MDDYRETVEKLAKLDSSEVFSNGRAEHARIIYETFLKHAKEHVYIFCRNLHPDSFTESVAQQMELALRRGIQVRIIAQEDPINSYFSNEIKRWKDAGLPIVFDVTISPHVAGFASNFAVMDKKAYRFEHNREKPEALACINGPEVATALVDTFRKL